jgi:hypothetical protein
VNERFDLVQRVEFIKRACEGKTVLHLGCTDYPYTEDAIARNMLLHFELANIAGELHGFDSDDEGLRILTSKGVNNLFKVDLENLDALELNKTYDVIVAGEMIEHLSNPGAFLNGIKRFMDRDSKLLITTVNAYCALRFLIYGLRGRGGANEPVHPDHVSYYSFSTMKLLLKRHGLEMREFYFYDLGKEHRPFNRWFYNLFNDAAVKVSRQLSDGIIAVAGLSD